MLLLQFAAVTKAQAQDTGRSVYYSREFNPDSTAVATEDTLADDENMRADEEADTASAAVVTDTVIFREVPDSAVKVLKAQRDFAYANDPEYWKKKKYEESAPGFWEWLEKWVRKGWWRWFFYLLIGGLLLFALYRLLVTHQLFLFYKSPAAAEETILPVTETDWQQQIELAVAAKNFTLAVRCHYLYTLQQLHHKGFIQYHPDATNYEYISKMSRHKQGAAFNKLTRVYEYVCYGNFEITALQYKHVADDFDAFNQSC